jgi:hypothetical protein
VANAAVERHEPRTKRVKEERTEAVDVLQSAWWCGVLHAAAAKRSVAGGGLQPVRSQPHRDGG